MANITKLITNAPPSGLRCQLVGGGKILASGTTKTEAEVNATADAALKKLQDEATKKALA